jgi:hydrogenase-4 component F
MILGEPTQPCHPVKASYLPLIAHLSIVLVAGLYLPDPVIGWFHRAAELLK